MAKSKSVLKRIRVNERNRRQNRFYKLAIKTSIKKYLALVEAYKKSQDKEAFKILNQRASLIYSRIDKALKKKVLHKNTAARKKSQIGKILTSLHS